MTKPNKQTNPLDGLATRDGFAAGILELGKTNRNVVALSADLTKSVGMLEFEEQYPDRFLQTGIAEQNMAGVAAGLALSGKIAFMGSFASFQPMRNLDQIRSSICMTNANVKIISSHAGFSYPADGIQIQTLEDIAVMRSLPNMTVLVPADAEQAKEMTLKAAEIKGPVYLRLGREKVKSLATFAEPSPLAIGKAQVIKPGKDLTVIACGYMVAEAFQAIAQLTGLDIGLVNMHTIKPLDEKAILHLAEQTGRIVTVEEHQKFGGLGSAVAEVLAQNNTGAQLKIVAVNDEFGETAKEVSEMYNSRHISARHIQNAILELMEL